MNNLHCKYYLKGPNIAYIYPDLETAFVGQFANGVMISANPAHIVTSNLINNIMVPNFKILNKEAKIGYCKSTKTSLGKDLLFSDPYEFNHIICKKSNVEGGGEGVFAVKDIPKDTIVAFYNGVRLPYRVGGPKEEWATSGYKIYINADYSSGERMDIPMEYVGLDKYCASLGHKVNHSFQPNCYEWFMDHPR